MPGCRMLKSPKRPFFEEIAQTCGLISGESSRALADPMLWNGRGLDLVLPPSRAPIRRSQRAVSLPLELQGVGSDRTVEGMALTSEGNGCVSLGGGDWKAGRRVKPTTAFFLGPFRDSGAVAARPQ